MGEATSFLCDAIQEFLKSIKRSNRERKKSKEKKKSMQISCFVKPISPRTGDITGPCHVCTGVKHVSAPGVINIL